MTKSQLLGLLFAIATAIFWGLYGPALGKARPGTDPNPFKAFIFIGLAYLVWGVIGGFVGVKATGGSFAFRPETINWGFVAGSLGAFGALTLTYAMFEARDARLVMPVVFGGATAVSAIAATILSRQHHVPPAQMVGFALVIVGVILIQLFGSHPGPAKPASAVHPTTSQDHPEKPAH
jgi:drug/metabolite transporter (DMT)-like permease